MSASPELGRVMPPYGGQEWCANVDCDSELSEETGGAYLYQDLESHKLCVLCDDCARHVELNHGHRFKLVPL